MARLTLAEAANRLGVSTRTLRRRIKEGRVYAALEENKYYLDAAEVDRLATLARQVDSNSLAMSKDKAKPLSTPTAIINLQKSDYDNLMSRLGFLEGQRQLLLEHEETMAAREREMAAAKARLAELEAELATREGQSREKIAALEAELNRLSSKSAWQSFKNWFWGRD